MKIIKGSRESLLRPLQVVSGIVERRNTMPILANVLIKKNGVDVSFLATDLEVQITTRASIGVGDEIEGTTVSARKILDILRALPDSGDVTISLTAAKMTVQAGKSRFSLQTIMAEDFPILAQPDAFISNVTLPQKVLKHLLHMVQFSMAQQDIRYYLNGVYLVLQGKKVIAVATDGHRLALCEAETSEDLPESSVIIPRKTVIELQRLLEESEDPVEIMLSASQAKFSFGSVEVISKLVEGKYPDYTRVIPSGYTNEFTLGRDELLRSLQRAAIMTSDKFKGVRCRIEPGVLKITSTNADQEEAAEELSIDYGGATVDVGMNVNYLVDVLNNLKCDQMRIQLGDSNSSILMTAPDVPGFKYVAMPMRI